MDVIYIFGHQNPDTDSVVSAMAYAALRNALGDRNVLAARLGHISDETRLVLDRFGFEPPLFLNTVRTQVRDLDYDKPPVVNSAVSVSHAWELLHENDNLSALPVVDDEGCLVGMLTAGGIAENDMASVSNQHVVDVPLFNMLSALQGQIINDAEEIPISINGELLIALPKEDGQCITLDKNSILLCGYQPEIIEEAIKVGVKCIIICQTNIPQSYRENKGNTCLISTPMDAYQASRMIFQSIPVSRITKMDNINSFHEDEFVDDVRESMLKSRFRSYPILDQKDQVIGALSRYHLIRPRRKRVILVDHNEFAQSVPGLEQAEIMEIIDHHRLADVQTGAPIFMRNEPVGSTSTIIATMFQEKGLTPSAKMAGLMSAAILSDTVMFKSPTSTKKDQQMAKRLARIAGISLEELGREIFSVSVLAEKPAEDILMSDYKVFHIAEHTLGIGQVTTIDSKSVLKRKKELLAAMEVEKQEKGYNILLLMVTDVLNEGSTLLYLGDEEIIKTAFSCKPALNQVYLPGVVSRKKQVVPALSLLWG